MLTLSVLVFNPDGRVDTSQSKNEQLKSWVWQRMIIIKKYDTYIYIYSIPWFLSPVRAVRLTFFLWPGNTVDANNNEINIIDAKLTILPYGLVDNINIGYIISYTPGHVSYNNNMHMYIYIMYNICSIQNLIRLMMPFDKCKRAAVISHRHQASDLDFTLWYAYFKYSAVRNTNTCRYTGCTELPALVNKLPLLYCTGVWY